MALRTRRIIWRNTGGFVWLLAALICCAAPVLDARGAGKSSKKKRNPTVELSTSTGNVVVELFPDKAPKTVANFLAYVRAGHYDGTVFHRVIDGFMIQGGGFDEKLEKKPTRAPVKNEADNGLKNETGTLAMARTPDPHSASAQFFINVSDNEVLDHRSKTPAGWGYCVFGKVIKGMDVVNKIKGARTGARGPFAKDAPLKNVVIRKARVR